MPLPMVHLCVAKEYSIYTERFGDSPEFYLGNISPDAIHMRENVDRSNKRMTHLYKDGKIDISSVNEFVRESKNKADYDFYLGYGMHILTDYFWKQTVYKNFINRYNEDLHPIQSMDEAYYNDTDSIDITLYKQYQWRPDMWEMLGKAEISEVDIILRTDEIYRWNVRTLNWFDEFDTSKLKPLRYISYDEVIKFINNTVKDISIILDSESL